MLIKPEELKEMLALAGKALLNMSPEDEDIEQWAERLAKDLVAAGEKEHSEHISHKTQTKHPPISVDNSPGLNEGGFLYY